MSTKKLSVIIPVYQAKDWLPATVNAVLDQTLEDFELILVDDGSTDGSGELCDAFALADRRVRVIHQENAGVSAARNAGLDAARGEFIGWVDSDDLIEADMFARLVELAETHSAAVAQCQHDRESVRNNGVRSTQVTLLTGPAFVERIFDCKGRLNTNQVSLWSKVFRRELWDGIRFPVGQVFEDEMQTYKVCLRADKLVETPDVLYHYIKRENSIITGETPRKMLDRQAALLDKLEYLPKRLPQLEEACARDFLSWSSRILCRMYDCGAWAEMEQATAVLLRQKKRLKPWMNRYDKLYMPLLKWKWARNWIARNDFAPIQNWLAKVKRCVRREG